LQSWSRCGDASRPRAMICTPSSVFPLTCHMEPEQSARGANRAEQLPLITGHERAAGNRALGPSERGAHASVERSTKKAPNCHTDARRVTGPGGAEKACKISRGGAACLCRHDWARVLRALLRRDAALLVVDDHTVVRSRLPRERVEP